MFSKPFLSAFGLVFSCLVLAGCGSASSGNNPSSSSAFSSSSASSVPSHQPVAITIPFAAVAGNTAIACGAILDGLGTSNTSGSIADFRFYVHNLRLVTSTGDEIPIELDETDMQASNIALLDFRDKLATPNPCEGEANPYRNTQLSGKVNIGNHTIASLRFVLGVPASHNHKEQATAPSPLQAPGLASGMNWNWNVGYKFTGLDLFTDAPIKRPNDGTANRFNVHLGSTGCTGDGATGVEASCETPNRQEFTLALNGRALDGFAVKLDYAQLLSTTDFNEDLHGPSGCMSGATDVQCAEIFAALGMAHATQTHAPGEQRVFSIIAK